MQKTMNMTLRIGRLCFQDYDLTDNLDRVSSPIWTTDFGALVSVAERDDESSAPQALLSVSQIQKAIIAINGGKPAKIQDDETTVLFSSSAIEIQTSSSAEPYPPVIVALSPKQRSSLMSWLSDLRRKSMTQRRSELQANTQIRNAEVKIAKAEKVIRDATRVIDQLSRKHGRY